MKEEEKREEGRKRENGQRGAKDQQENQERAYPKWLLHRDQKVGGGKQSSGTLKWFKLGVVMRSAERSQDSVIGTCDAQRDWWPAFDMLNRYLSHLSLVSLRPHSDQ